MRLKSFDGLVYGCLIERKYNSSIHRAGQVQGYTKTRDCVPCFDNKNPGDVAIWNEIQVTKPVLVRYFVDPIPSPAAMLG